MSIKNLIKMSESFPVQKTEAWLNMRKMKITSTDIGMIMGGRDNDIRELIDKKLGKPQTFQGNEATRWGELNEPLAMDRFAQLWNVNPIFLNVLAHKKYPQYIFSPDGVLPNGDIIEIKSPFSRIINSSISAQYKCQVQMGMEIMKSHGFHYSKAYFVEYKPLGHSYEKDVEIISVKIVQQDPEFFEKLHGKATEIWNEINKIKDTAKKENYQIDFDGFLEI